MPLRQEDVLSFSWKAAALSALAGLYCSVFLPSPWNDHLLYIGWILCAVFVGVFIATIILPDSVAEKLKLKLENRRLRQRLRRQKKKEEADV